MRLKWVSLIFLALLLGSCASLTYNKPPWGTSNEPYAILAGLPNASSGWTFDFYEVPSQNQIQVRYPNGRVREINDRGGNLDDLRLALAKYSEWKDQLKDTEGKVSKPIRSRSSIQAKKRKSCPTVITPLHSPLKLVQMGSITSWQLNWRARNALTVLTTRNALQESAFSLAKIRS